jgi:hypothetical protein
LIADLLDTLLLQIPSPNPLFEPFSGRPRESISVKLGRFAIISTVVLCRSSSFLSQQKTNGFPLYYLPLHIN